MHNSYKADRFTWHLIHWHYHNLNCCKVCGPINFLDSIKSVHSVWSLRTQQLIPQNPLWNACFSINDDGCEGSAIRQEAWGTGIVSRYSLANHIPRLLVNEARCSVASETLVHLALVSLKPGRTHTLHISTTGQRAGLGVHAVVVADVCAASVETEREREGSLWATGKVL